MRRPNTLKLIVILFEKLLSKEICTEFVGSNDHLADVLPKSLRGRQIEFICSKLVTYNLYASIEGEC